MWWSWYEWCCVLCICGFWDKLVEVVKLEMVCRGRWVRVSGWPSGLRRQTQVQTYWVFWSPMEAWVRIPLLTVLHPTTITRNTTPSTPLLSSLTSTHFHSLPLTSIHYHLTVPPLSLSLSLSLFLSLSLHSTTLIPKLHVSFFFCTTPCPLLQDINPLCHDSEWGISFTAILWICAICMKNSILLHSQQHQFNKAHLSCLLTKRVQ